MSIKSKLILYVGILLFVVCVCLATGIYLFASNAMTKATEESLARLALEASRVVEARIQGEVNGLTVMAGREDILDTVRTWEEKKAILNAEIQRSGYLDMAIADLSGNAQFANTGEIVDISGEAYFQSAAAGEVVVTDPIANAAEKTLVMIFAVPVKVHGQVSGILIAVRDGASLSKTVGDLDIGASGKAFMLNQDGVTIAHSNIDFVLAQDNNFENVKSDPKLNALVALEKKMVEGERGAGFYSYNGVEKILGYAPIPGSGWSIAVTALRNEALGHLSDLKLWLPILSVIILVIGIAVAYWVARAISEPVRVAADHLQVVSARDLSRAVPPVYLGRKDEIGLLARSVHTMQEGLRSALGGVLKQSDAIDAASNQVEAAVMYLDQTADTTFSTVQELSAGLEETAASAEEVNASTVEIERGIEVIAAKAQNGSIAASQINQRAKELAASVSRSLHASGQVVDETRVKLSQAIKDAESINQIHRLSQSILQITSQTNLLALNAAIEAARAGEAGQGFAVVAREIRSLAEESQTAASEIQQVTNLVLASVQNLRDSSAQLMELMDTQIKEDYQAMLETAEHYREDAEMVNQMVEEFSATSQQLKASIEGILRAIDEVTITINEGAAGAEDITIKTGAIVEKMAEVRKQMQANRQSARELKELAGQFTL